MKKITYLVFCIGILLTTTSCFNTRLLVGNVEPNDPVIEVQKEWNHHFLFGLIPAENAKMKPAEYVDDKQNYVVRTNTSFLNGLVSGLTFGIYTPTQTTYYIPLSDK